MAIACSAPNRLPMIGCRYLFCLVVVAVSAMAQAPIKFDSATVSGLPARNIGSAVMSGRIAAVDAAHDQGRLTIFAGAASGGVWKSVNGGTTFTSVFDKPDVQSIGAVTIDPTNSKVVWVGTGESWVRNSVSVGDGIYKSTDGGDNWTNMGLKDSEHISRILVDPKDGNTVYACATGHLWNDAALVVVIPPVTCGMTTTSAAFTKLLTAASRGRKYSRARTARPAAEC